jgi:hypothetical protein
VVTARVLVHAEHRFRPQSAKGVCRTLIYRPPLSGERAIGPATNNLFPRLNGSRVPEGRAVANL